MPVAAMSESKPFTLAVVKGRSRGKVLRTDKPRISVGSARENDLAIEDPEISARHFLVLIDHGRWRVHTFSAEKTITVDRRWSHPNNGDRGALISAASTEILLYPGELDQTIIDREILEREDSMPVPVVTDADRQLVTQIREVPAEFARDEKSQERTVAIDMLSTMPTITDPLPEEIRIAARNKLMEERRPTISNLPEVIPEAESKIFPGSEKSIVAPVGLVDSKLREVPQVNAWGDASKRKSERPERAERPKNAWGDPTEKAPPQREQPQPQQQHPLARVRDSDGANGRDTPVPRSHAAPPPIQKILAIEELAHLFDPAMSILREPDGEMATSIRLLGTRIEEFMRMYGYRAYMISSPEPLTGKTTTAANLALALAEDTHRRIALIEANFRYPRFAEIFGMPDDYGLIPLLEGRVQLPEAIAKIADRNLVILPSGGRHPSPAELLSSPRFKALVAELANTVDIAIIDAPAVTPFADANLILPLVDAAMLVVSEHKTHASWIGRAQSQLGEARILGTVYNRMPKAKIKELKLELRERMREKRP